MITDVKEGHPTRRSAVHGRADSLPLEEEVSGDGGGVGEPEPETTGGGLSLNKQMP